MEAKSNDQLSGNVSRDRFAHQESLIDWKSRCIFLISNDDGGVLLDMDNDKFLKLDAIAAEMWRSLADGQTEDSIATRIATQCNVAVDRVLQDLRGLVKEMRSLSIMPEQTSCSRPNVADTTPGEYTTSFPWYGHDLSISRPTPEIFSTFLAFFGLLLFDLVLSFKCLKSLCAMVSGWKIRSRAPVDKDVVGRICVAVERACVWYPKKAVCLQRSAVTTCLLRNSGVPAQMVFAARPMPLLFHAWVEVSGNVINDHPTVAKAYRRLVSF
jgi:hypothetical protein